FMPPGRAGTVACSRATIATSYPSTTLRPDASLVDPSRPRSIHRRTVSSLTPRYTDASETRMCGTGTRIDPHLRTCWREAPRLALVHDDVTHRRSVADHAAAVAGL